jgi:hypothetical protein
MTAASEFPDLQEATQVIDQLDEHRRRQVMAFGFERYGFSLQPSAKKIIPTPNPNNRSEFAALEQLTDILDRIGSGQHGPAIAYLAANFGAKVAPSYKPSSGGFSKKRRFSKG